tara:strand:+ start:8947 stop:9426 length:480 start_codon:yes stop_codon:yes gene_type:complete
MTVVLAVDPGNSKSGWVIYDAVADSIVSAGIDSNEDLLVRIRQNTGGCDQLVLEMIASYGMPVGREVFETCVWIGRFWEAFPGQRDLIYRKDVKLCVCGSPRAKDSNIRQALIDRFGPGRELAIGKKNSPGPLYGFKRDMWAALGVAVTWLNEGGADGS